MTDDKLLELAKQDKPISREELGLKPIKPDNQMDIDDLRIFIFGACWVGMCLLDVIGGCITTHFGFTDLTSLIAVALVVHASSIMIPDVLDIICEQ